MLRMIPGTLPACLVGVQAVGNFLNNAQLQGVGANTVLVQTGAMTATSPAW